MIIPRLPNVRGLFRILFFILCSICLLSLPIGILYGGELYACTSYGSVTGRYVHYQPFAECYVQTRVGMVPRSEFERRAITNEAPNEQ